MKENLTYYLVSFAIVFSLLFPIVLMFLSFCILFSDAITDELRFADGIAMLFIIFSAAWGSFLLLNFKEDLF